jgi:hypothetical protein
MNVYAAALAAARSTLDSYWLKFGIGDQSKTVKQCYVDYTSADPVVITIFADGSLTPYYTYTLPAEPNRAVIRVRFPAIKLRTFRIIITSGASMQIWSTPRLEWKPILASGANGYASYEVNS